MNCKQCNKEFEAERDTAKYCSPKCRKLAFQGTQKVSVPVSVPLKEISVTLEEVCTSEEMNEFPNMCETKRQSKESVYRLENNEIDDLRANGFAIPPWRVKGKIK